MKILSLSYGQAFKYITEGWKSVFEATGHEWAWLYADKPVFDAFQEFEPDIFLGTTYDLDRATIKCIKKRPEMAVILKGQNWGSSDKDISRGGSIPAKTHDKNYKQVNEERVENEKHFPIGISEPEEQERICNLRKDIDNRMLVYNLYHKKRMKETMGYWDDNGVETIDMQPAADHFKHRPAAKIDMLESDISFIGGYWRYKAINIDKYIVPLCYPIGKYNIKIFGYHEWPVPQFLGPVQDRIVNNIFSSAKICPNVSEPHANEFGFEVNERVFKLSACKAFCLSDHIDSLVQDIFTEGEMPTAKSAEEFHEKIDYYLDNPDLRENHAEKCYETVMREHTYCHRVANLLSRIGLDEEAGRCLDIINKGTHVYT
tara:strand:+ start:1364 stop:2482 length:1119 start_codon:yes stop_codon:yes gene_type:complete